MSWSDNFNRANGDLGADWEVKSGAAVIDAQHVVAPSISRVLQKNASVAGAQSVSVLVTVSEGGGESAGPMIKCDATTFGYSGTVEKGSGEFRTRIWGYNIGQLATTLHTGTLSYPVTLTLTYDSGVINLYVDGVLRETVSNNTYASKDRLGFVVTSSTGSLDDFSTSSYTPPTPPALHISPSEVYAGNPLNALAATLTDTAWSSVDPPSSSLSVDHGWLTLQTIETTTRANFSWQALAYVGTVTVTDSETGLSATFYSSGTPVEGTGESWPLTEDGAAILNRTGDSCASPGVILTTCTPVDGEGDVRIPAALDAILEQLGGYPGQIGPDIGAVSLPEAIYRAINGKSDVGDPPYGDLYVEPLAVTLRKIFDLWLLEGGPETYTVADVLAQLGGSPTLYSHADLNTTIGNSLSATTAAIDAAVESIKGLGLPDLAAILALLGTVQDDLATDVGQIRADVAGLSFATPASVAAVSDKLDLIQPSTAVDLTTVTNQLTTVDSVVDATSSSLSALRTASAYTLATVKGWIDDLAAALPTSSWRTAPVWPGLANATVGAAVALSDGLEILGPLDGLLIAITGAPTRAGRFAFGDTNSWRYCGAVVFRSDRGDYEWNHPIGLDSQVVTPKCMVSAAAARFRLEGGFSGTVRPFTINT